MNEEAHGSLQFLPGQPGPQQAHAQGPVWPSRPGLLLRKMPDAKSSCLYLFLCLHTAFTLQPPWPH